MARRSATAGGPALDCGAHARARTHRRERVSECGSVGGGSAGRLPRGVRGRPGAGAAFSRSLSRRALRTAPQRVPAARRPFAKRARRPVAAIQLPEEGCAVGPRGQVGAAHEPAWPNASGHRALARRAGGAPHHITVGQLSIRVHGFLQPMELQIALGELGGGQLATEAAAAAARLR
eukprot:7235001-Prymnesium_polylepis.1